MASIGGSGRRDATGPPALLRQLRLAVIVDPESLAAGGQAISFMSIAPLTPRLANLWTPTTRRAPPVTAVDVTFDLPLAENGRIC